VTLANKRAVITGASQGLGLAIAEAFLREGARVTICARNAADLATAAGSLEAISPGNVFTVKADVGIEADVDALAAAAVEQMGGVDILVCNAGVYGPKGPIDTLDWQAWADAIRINLVGAVYCCRVFLPILRKSSRAKILIISGGGATKPLPFVSAYAASKAGLVRFAETLAEELKPEGIDVNAIAPGALNTRMLDEVLAAGPETVGEPFYKAALKQRDSGGTPLHVGASLCAFLCTQAADGITGRLISAQWDPWKHFELLKDDLAKTDIYTLRRIIPAERGKSWDDLL